MDAAAKSANPRPALIRSNTVRRGPSGTVRAPSDSHAAPRPIAEITASGADAVRANQSSLTPWLRTASGASAITTKPTAKTLSGAHRFAGSSQSPTTPAHLGTTASIRMTVPAAIPKPPAPRSRPCTEEARFAQLSTCRPPEFAPPESTST